MQRLATVRPGTGTLPRGVVDRSIVVWLSYKNAWEQLVSFLERALISQIKIQFLMLQLSVRDIGVAIPMTTVEHQVSLMSRKTLQELYL